MHDVTFLIKKVKTAVLDNIVQNQQDKNIFTIFLFIIHRHLFFLMNESVFNLDESVFDKIGRTRPPAFELVWKAELNPPTCDAANM